MVCLHKYVCIILYSLITFSQGQENDYSDNYDYGGKSLDDFGGDDGRDVVIDDPHPDSVLLSGVFVDHPTVKRNPIIFEVIGVYEKYILSPKLTAYQHATKKKFFLYFIMIMFDIGRMPTESPTAEDFHRGLARRIMWTPETELMRINTWFMKCEEKQSLHFELRVTKVPTGFGFCSSGIWVLELEEDPDQLSGVYRRNNSFYNGRPRYSSINGGFRMLQSGKWKLIPNRAVYVYTYISHESVDDIEQVLEWQRRDERSEELEDINMSMHCKNLPSENENPCEEDLCNGFKCISPASKQYRCDCPYGYTGDHCESQKSCPDVPTIKHVVSMGLKDRDAAFVCQYGYKFATDTNVLNHVWLSPCEDGQWMSLPVCVLTSTNNTEGLYMYECAKSADLCRVSTKTQENSQWELQENESALSGAETEREHQLHVSPLSVFVGACLLFDVSIMGQGTLSVYNEADFLWKTQEPTTNWKEYLVSLKKEFVWLTFKGTINEPNAQLKIKHIRVGYFKCEDYHEFTVTEPYTPAETTTIKILTTESAEPVETVGTMGDGPEITKGSEKTPLFVSTTKAMQTEATTTATTTTQKEELYVFRCQFEDPECQFTEKDIDGKEVDDSEKTWKRDQVTDHGTSVVQEGSERKSDGSDEERSIWFEPPPDSIHPGDCLVFDAVICEGCTLIVLLGQSSGALVTIWNSIGIGPKYDWGTFAVDIRNSGELLIFRTIRHRNTMGGVSLHDVRISRYGCSQTIVEAGLGPIVGSTETSPDETTPYIQENSQSSSPSSSTSSEGVVSLIRENGMYISIIIVLLCMLVAVPYLYYKWHKEETVQEKKRWRQRMKERRSRRKEHNKEKNKEGNKKRHFNIGGKFSKRKQSQPI